MKLVWWKSALQEMKKSTKLQKTDRENARLIQKLSGEVERLRSEIGRLQALTDIHHNWTQLREKGFPPQCRGRSVHGLDLVMLDADVAGCVLTFLGRGTLDRGRIKILSLSKKRFNQVIAGLDGHPRFYYRQLRRLISAVLDYLHDYATTS